MFQYQPPLKDINFVLADMFQAADVLQQYPGFVDVDHALIQQVIEEAGRFASEVLFPLNATADAKGSALDNGRVITPQGYAQAYHQFCEAGWPALACDPDYGGQGLPHTLNSVLYEMLNATNLAWTMFPGLLHGAYSCIHRYASDHIKNTYLPKIVSGEWLATMCLTEPHAGSDLGLLRTKAIPNDDGSYQITGTKIFISGGDQDITDNIVHLVLARLPDAPAGSKGISLFVVPKIFPDGDRAGQHNAVTCTGLEHKMGIHGSPTCTMQFEEATGWLVGEPHRGLAAMFVMMNSARLQVGIGGLGIAETAYQNALIYANERLQSRAVMRPEHRKTEAADPIVMHPPVQRLLMTQRAWVEGCRMLAYYSALLLDGAEHHPDEAQRKALDEQLALLTPIIKALMTDQGFAGASQALQVYGGHGYVCETGIEQYMRDVRITMIYEGTNEIQAIDLLMRKILADNGKRLGMLLDDIEQTIAETTHESLASATTALLALTRTLRTLIPEIGQAGLSYPDLPHQIAPEVLRLVGHCAIAWLWLKAANVARTLQDKDPDFYLAKQTTAQYYFTFVLPESQQLITVIKQCLANAKAGQHQNYQTVLSVQ
ncbi:acyl-CoA dehydrogenase C-terminal domain-containing protein [Pusillimonas sp. NJUB218]|uniref:acyl-CoA dehydrogenase C-terminal domain-containing protein n=1 Tax=Pusillimonas sp. NJUB218 TaxID=2023230 RepID=UPI000F4C3FCE|nr:acyl-CoA dehydrogenase C-terminal domain-containing protein [Pusillimonas sp. NJUB218]ROT43950.1 acyl-CoA dehydrogenase [Pusillimonas sp. NJUB218]